MPAEAVTIKGLPELTRKIKNLQDFKQLVPELKASASHIKGSVAKYPPQTSANIPAGPGSRWYVRGSGPRYMRKDGSVWKPKKATSETLGRKWTTKKRDRGFTWAIGNNASYGPFVQDKNKQARIHKRRGWKTIQDVAKQEAPMVLNLIKKKIDRILAK